MDVLDMTGVINEITGFKAQNGEVKNFESIEHLFAQNETQSNKSETVKPSTITIQSSRSSINL